MDTQFAVVPTTVPLNAYSSPGRPRPSDRLRPWSLWSALRFAPDKLFFDHLGQVVIAIVMLKDLDQLGIRQRLKRK